MTRKIIPNRENGQIIEEVFYNDDGEKESLIKINFISANEIETESFDSNGEKHTVDGDGVVGETPTIKPGGHFKYNSGCNLNSEIGYMKGFYTLKDILTGKQFDVQIPKFDLIVPAKLN
mgnify:CR=1 FL=1